MNPNDGTQRLPAQGMMIDSIPGGNEVSVLAIRFGSLGDVVLTLPALAWLKQHLPGVRIGFITHGRYAGLLAHADVIETILPWTGYSTAMAARDWLNGSSKAPLLLDFQASLRSRWVSQVLNVTTARTPQYSWKRRRMVTQPPWRWLGGVPHPLEPIWRRHCETAALGLLRLEETGTGLRRLEAEPGVWQPPERLLRIPVSAECQRESRTVCFAPLSQHRAKSLTINQIQRWIVALHSAGLKVILLGSPAEKAELERAATQLDSVEVITESWREILRALGRATWTLSVDSGLAHVSESVGTPTRVLFGPTIPAFGFAPRLRESKVIESVLACRPCHVHGPQVCPLNHHLCMESLPLSV